MPRTPSMHLALALGCHSMMRLAFSEHCSMDAWGIFSKADVVR